MGQKWVRKELVVNLSVAQEYVYYSFRSCRVVCILLFIIASAFVNQAAFDLYIFSKVFHFSPIS
jgi:hypothetical protein